MSARFVPFHCPFCADENLWPHEPATEGASETSGHGAWECRACLRAFKLTSLGQIPAPASTAAQSNAEASQ